MFYAITSIALSEYGLLLPADISAVNQTFVDDDKITIVYGGIEYVAYTFHKNKLTLVLPRHVAVDYKRLQRDKQCFYNDRRNYYVPWWCWQGVYGYNKSEPYFPEPPVKIPIVTVLSRPVLISAGSCKPLALHKQINQPYSAQNYWAQALEKFHRQICDQLWQQQWQSIGHFNVTGKEMPPREPADDKRKSYMSEFYSYQTVGWNLLDLF